MIGLVVDSTLRRSMVETLQRAILPPTLPDLPGMAIAARYLPASHALGIGGDWYSCDVHADGPLSLVVGDVAGHGLAAVAAMAELRHTARGYGLAGYSPAAITTQLSANLRASPGTVEEIDADTEGALATTIVAQLALDTRRLTWSCAGHPPPLLIVGTDAAYLDDVHGPMLGVDPALAYGQSTLDLPPGARLLLYTDGLVERRGTSITHRLDTLAAAASDNPQQGAGGLDHLCDRILAAVAGPADQEDDICLLAIQTP
jgi:serine phosphatase RsbU (regulator of sigma subunit)